MIYCKASYNYIDSNKSSTQYTQYIIKIYQLTQLILVETNIWLRKGYHRKL